MDEERGPILYSKTTVFIYIFNLTLGSGVLALPSLFSKSGWALSLIILPLIVFMSFIGTAFIIESMASANAIINLTKQRDLNNQVEEGTPLLHQNREENYFQIKIKVELGQMAEMFFNRIGRALFYFIFIIYLYGSLTVSSSIVAISTVQFFYESNDHPKFAKSFFALVFAVIMLPFCFSDFTKTKLLQQICMVGRQISIILIITLSFFHVEKFGSQLSNLKLMNLRQLPNLLGGFIFSFMCHHSLPGIVSFLKDKEKENKIIFYVFAVVSFIYSVFCFSTAVAFGKDIQTPITNNFSHDEYGYLGSGLILFPIFTIASTFPIMAITLKNNIFSLYYLLFSYDPSSNNISMKEKRSLSVNKKLQKLPRSNSLQIKFRKISNFYFTAFAAVPPLLFPAIPFKKEVDVNQLVGVTGSYSGCMVMFVIPTALVYFARIELTKIMVGSGVQRPSFPFQHNFFLILLISWSFFILCCMLLNDALNYFHF